MGNNVQHRYMPNPNFGGRKEKDGFICSSITRKGNIWTNCVAVKMDDTGVHVRDTKDGADITLHFTDREWDAFIKGVKIGEFDKKG